MPAGDAGTRLEELRGRLHEVSDLRSAAAVLNWDQSTYMPPRGAAARGRQIATLSRLAHEKFTAPEVGALLDALAPHAEALPYDSIDASMVRVGRRAYERATRVPASFLGELHEHIATAYQAWTDARPRNDFASVAPLLQKTLDMSRRLADFHGDYEHIADPLIDEHDYGMKASSLRKIFAELRDGLVPLVKAISARPPADVSCLRQHYPEGEQIAFGEHLIRTFGYDFERGRQDKTPHPFMTRFSSGDCRITTRIDENDLGWGLFSTLHEAGHALYELGIDPELEGTLLDEGTSSGVHESQSRLWENLIGRSRAFWEFGYPEAQRRFPSQLGDVPLDTFHRAVNKVERSLIRTEADEVTYNLHVIIRFELELALLEGTLEVGALPEAWRGRYAEYLGVTPPDDRTGVLQDVHWYGGTIGGMFQGYTLGNLFSAQVFEKLTEAHPDIEREIERGELSSAGSWLEENIYRHGSKLTAPELIERVTGGPLRVTPYLDYLRAKYGEIYELRGAKT